MITDPVPTTFPMHFWRIAISVTSQFQISSTNTNR